MLSIPNNENLPKFTSPPVIETVISLQFSPLSDLTSAHVGWFWKKYLAEDWKTVNEAPCITDQFERFGDERAWSPLGTGAVMLRTKPGLERIQILRADQQRMLQIQNSRFILNWKKGVDSYPTYTVLKPEYLEHIKTYKQFLNESNGWSINPNQWEITYVNHLLQGDLWSSLPDIKKLLPWIDLPTVSLFNPNADSYNCDIAFVIGDSLGRLHISLKYARLESGKGQEVFVLNLTARGPINKDIDYETGFDIGHAAIVQSFHDILSDYARDYFGRR